MFKQGRLEKTFQEIIYGFINKRTSPKFVLAVSAGVDSMVLLELFRRLAQKDPDIDFSVAYVNHQLRQESQVEEELVADYCRDHGIRLYATRWQEGNAIKVGIEEAARNFRYQWFEQVMKLEKASYLVTAHHRDDQVETILMKLIRGSCLTAITGMPKERPFADGYLIRPLLGISKERIYGFAHAEDLKYLEDSSNQELMYQRNRIRLSLLPKIKKENPQFQEHLIDFSEDLSDLVEVLQPLVEEKTQDLIQPCENGWVIDRQVWQSDLSLAWQRLILNYFFEQEFHANGIFVKGKQVKSVLGLMESTRPQAILTLNGNWQVRRTYQKLYIEQVISDHQGYSSKENVLVRGPGDYILSDDEELILIEEDRTFSRMKEDYYTFQINQSQLPLLVRHRRTGDQLQLGVNPVVHQSLKRWFINQKIPKDVRDTIWVVEDCHQMIIALLGYRTFQLSLIEETDRILVNYRKHDNKTNNEVYDVNS